MAVLHKIDVAGIRLYTNHGCMNEEAIIGSHYEVNISVWANLSASVESDDLKDTVDYVALHAIAKEEMASRDKALRSGVPAYFRPHFERTSFGSKS